MKKINNRTRIRVDPRICKEFNSVFFTLSVAKILCDQYHFRLTSRKYYLVYFQPYDQQKLMLFMMKYGEYLIDKDKIYKYY